VILTLFTIGHSTRTIAEFVTMLRQVTVDWVIDVRSIPRSRTNPQFNSASLSGSLLDAGITYRHSPALGGRRHRSRGATPSPNTWWRNESFRNYADYAATEAFSAGFEELRALIREHCCAIMCAEAVWWRCHRRIVTEYLIAAGFAVEHIFDEKKREPAKLTPGAVIRPGGTILYEGNEPRLL
jgi:uncharacterized protein (DUF488 family)